MINVSLIFVFITIERFLEIRKEQKQKQYEKKLNRASISTRKKKLLMTRWCSWFIIFNFQFCRRFCFLTSTSFRFSKSILIMNLNANVTTKSTTKIVVWIEIESATNIFAKSTKKEIKIVKKRIKTSRFISSNIEFTIDLSRNAEIKKKRNRKRENNHNKKDRYNNNEKRRNKCDKKRKNNKRRRIDNEMLKIRLCFDFIKITTKRTRIHKMSCF
jgi:hypothetical protein